MQVIETKTIYTRLDGEYVIDREEIRVITVEEDFDFSTNWWSELVEYSYAMYDR